MALARVMRITTAMGVGVVGCRGLGRAVVVVLRKVVGVVGLALADSGAMGGGGGDVGGVLSGIRAGDTVSIDATTGRLIGVVELWLALDGVEYLAVLFPPAGAAIVKSISGNVAVVLAVTVVTVGASAGDRDWPVGAATGTEIFVGAAGACIPAEAGRGRTEGSTVAEVVVEIAGSVGMVVASAVVVVPDSVKIPVVSVWNGHTQDPRVAEVLDFAGMPVDLGSEMIVEDLDSMGISDLRMLVGVLDFDKVSATSSPGVVVRPPDPTGRPSPRVEVEAPDPARTPVVSGSELVVDVQTPTASDSDSDSDSVVMLEVVPYSVDTGFESVVGVMDSTGMPTVLGPGTVVEALDSTGSSDSVAVL